MTEPVDSPRQQLREALRTTVTLTIARIMGDKKILRRMGDGIYVDIDAVADAVIAAAVEAGWGPTAAHPDAEALQTTVAAYESLEAENDAALACITRLREGWTAHLGGPYWNYWVGHGRCEPMTEAEQEMMSR